MPHVHKIFGPPGTGKTTRLISIVKECMADGIPIEQIAYLAHTKAAADEAYDRVRDVAGTKRPRYFCTIHAAARRITTIPRNQIWGGAEWNELQRATGMRFNVGAEWDDSDTNSIVGDPLIQCINFAHSRMISLDEAIKNFERYEIVSMVNLYMVQQAISIIKKERQRYDFDDILTMYHETPQPLPVRVVLVDEAQDLSVFQWKVVQQMWEGAERVILCGDDDQSIYAFLGADPDGFLNYPCDTSEVLPVSWRVPRLVGAIAEKIISRVQHRQAKTLTWRDADGVVQRIYADKQTLPIKKGEKTLVLVRHNVQGRAVYKAIREEGIPVAYNGESYLLDNEAKALSIYHRLREGGVCSLAEAIHMLREIPNKQKSIDRIEHMKTLGGKQPKLKADDFDLEFVANPANVFGVTMMKAKLFSLLCWNVEKYGTGVLLKLPEVQVMTIHASKGREADHVIILPDCFTSVWEGQQGQERETEAKVAYVAVTRTRSRLSVVYPKSDMYIRPLMEAV